MSSFAPVYTRVLDDSKGDRPELESLEDVFASSLESLYDYPQVSISSLYTHETTGITVAPPDPSAPNWALQADAIWVSSIYLANHLDELPYLNNRTVLELGAAAGLPGIAIKKEFPDAQVCLSDFPDPSILTTLHENAKRNNVEVDVWLHAWGATVEPHRKYDLIVAADILWNSEAHTQLLSTLSSTLQAPAGEIYLVAGMHTGRFVLERFLKRVGEVGLKVNMLEERRVDGSEKREWIVEREGESDSERRRWVLWIQLKWQ